MRINGLRCFVMLPVLLGIMVASCGDERKKQENEAASPPLLPTKTILPTKTPIVTPRPTETTKPPATIEPIATTSPAAGGPTPTPLTNMTAIAVGGIYTCSLATSGGVKCWGNNSSGQLGDGTTTQRPTAVDVSGLTSGVSAVAAGGSHTCVLTTVGGVKCWGGNSSGQLGDGTTTQRLTAVDVSGLTSGVAAISVGGKHTCALTTAGAVKCWGGNSSGQLGDGTTTQRLTAVDVSGLTSGVSAIAAGFNHTCAIITGGGVKCWGGNGEGQVGDGTTTQRLTAVDVSGLASGVAAIAAGAGYESSRTCAITAAGGGKCWGRNRSGQLGDGTTTQRLTAVDVSGLTSGVTAIAIGRFHTCASTTGGGVKCWGDNSEGRLGDGSRTDRLTAVDVSGLTSGVAAIASNESHTCAITTGGGVKCWGRNRYGQLGDGTSESTPGDVSGLTSGMAAIAAGGGHTCALTTGGGAKCWGSNFNGELGDGTSVDERPTAVDVSGLSSGVASIDAGSSYTCAVTSGGGAKCWGRNVNGQLGDGTTTQRLTAVDVAGLTSGVATIATGTSHACAVMTVGEVKCWGSNSSGQLGDGTTTQRLTAVGVAGLTSGVKTISIGDRHSCALLNTGGVKCWGDNGQGEVGDGTTTQRLTVVDVSGLASGVAAIAASGSSGEGSSTHVLTTGGGVKSWGSNSTGHLGDGTTTQRLTAVDVFGLKSGVVAIATDTLHACAVTTGGGVKCWGSNSYGQLGRVGGVATVVGF